MSVNISKTMIVPFFSKSPLDEFSFVFVNKQLKVVNEHKYLGCYFDRELSFKFHIEAALQRAAKASFAAVQEAAASFAAVREAAASSAAAKVTAATCAAAKEAGASFAAANCADASH